MIIPRSYIAELLKDELAPWVSNPENVTRVLDLCTGSGCLGIIAAEVFPNAKVDCVDISQDALDVAKINVERYGMQDRIELIKSDLFNELGDRQYDVIISNPPYVRESEKRLMHRNVLEHEPGLALFVPDDDPLLFYRAIADFAGKRLNAGGFGAVEINEAFGEAVAGIFSASGLHDVRTVEDFRAKIRFVTFRK